ncbi:MAG: PDZ domain-containing protein [Firmicutes bacterium]|nr:PDZ domain-containing protein [Bacillota bacterium]
MKNFKRICTTLLLIALIFTTVTPTFAEGENEEVKMDIEYLKSVLEFIKTNHVGDVNEKDLIEAAVNGMFDSLDEYSNYYNEEEFSELNEKVSGKFGGIGLRVTEKDGFITVITPLEGTPGFKAGIKPGDKIVKVNDTDIKDFTLTKAVKLMRGEKDTKVKLGIIREEREGILYFNITRDIININPITYKVLEDNIGYIKISKFNSNAAGSFLKALNEMDNKDITKLVIDVRNNPGGYLEEVINICRFVIPKGPIVHIKDSSDEMETYRSIKEDPKYKLAVLVNGGSASASEIFAGAVKDSNIGTVIGTKTFGKGSVQRTIPLKNKAGIKLTIAEYFTRNKEKVDGIGITPDIKIENNIKPKIDLEDIPKLKKERKAKLNTVGLDVLAAEKILNILGYEIKSEDGILDKTTFNSISKFQRDNGLYAYGVLDYSTQDTLTKKIKEYAYSNEDKQLNKAIDVLKSE